MFKNEIIKLLQQVVPKEFHSLIQVTVPERAEHGDFTTNIAMILAAKEKKNPREIANKIKSKLSVILVLDTGIHKKMDSRLRGNDNGRGNDKEIIVDKIEVAGSGYLNFFLTSSVYDSVINSILDQKDTYGSNKLLANKRIMVEFGHPNPFKVIHIGHLRNFFIGESICRLLEFEGAEVIRTNYQGDVGMHVAKCVWAMRKQIKDLKDTSINARVKFLSDCYVQGAKAFEEDEKAKSEITDINKAIYTNTDKEITKLWKMGVEWSLEKFQVLYKRLDTFYLREYMESETVEKAAKNIARAIKKGILVKSKGATVFIGEKYGLDTRVFLNSKELLTYEGKELGLAEMEFSDFGHLDLCIHNVGVEQKSFFEVTFKVEALLDPGRYEGKQYHNAYELVGLKHGKMSSRKGQVVTGESILDEAFNRIKHIIVENETQLADEEINAIALGAVKYSFLSMSAFKYLAFDLEASLSFKGDSGPYLQYAYTRCVSVLNKQQTTDSAKGRSAYGRNKQTTKQELNPEEMALVKRLLQFPEVVEKSSTSYSPHHVATYLNELAQEFSSFYNGSKIIGNEQKISLTRAVAQVLKNGLYLLGIKTVEKM